MGRDEAWFEGLYRRRRAAVSAYCARRVGLDEAQDAVSQTFAVAWRRRADVPELRRELPWLYGVARRIVMHQWRSTRRAARLNARVQRFEAPPEATPEAVVVMLREHELVRRAVEDLRAVDREVLLLSAWEELNHREIAEVLGCTKEAIDKRIVRAKARLAERFEALEAGERTSPGLASRGGTAR